MCVWREKRERVRDRADASASEQEWERWREAVIVHVERFLRWCSALLELERRLMIVEHTCMTRTRMIEEHTRMTWHDVYSTHHRT